MFHNAACGLALESKGLGVHAAPLTLGLSATNNLEKRAPPALPPHGGTETARKLLLASVRFRSRRLLDCRTAAAQLAVLMVLLPPSAQWGCRNICTPQKITTHTPGIPPDAVETTKKSFRKGNIMWMSLMV